MLNWGIIGVALGISLVGMIGAPYVIWILIRGKAVLHLTQLHQYRPNMNFLKQICYVGVPAGVESFIFHLGKLLKQVFIGWMGAIDISSIINLIHIPGNALCTVSTTIVGQEIGKGELDEARKSLQYNTRFADVCLVLLRALSITTGRYTNNADVLDYATKLIQLSALATPIWPSHGDKKKQVMENIR